MARKYEGKLGEHLHYRGWTLVDRPDARYAAKGLRYKRVCGIYDQHSLAMKAFHKVVDAEEG